MKDASGGYAAGSGWTDAWSGMDLAHAISPVKLGGWTPNIHSDTVKALLAGDGSADRTLMGEYKADRVVVAIAEIDKGAKRLHVSLACTDAVGPFVLKRSYRLGGDTAYAMELSAVVALGVLEGRWKAVQAVSRGGVATIAGLPEKSCRSRPSSPRSVNGTTSGGNRRNARRRGRSNRHYLRPLRGHLAALPRWRRTVGGASAPNGLRCAMWAEFGRLRPSF